MWKFSRDFLLPFLHTVFSNSPLKKKTSYLFEADGICSEVPLLIFASLVYFNVDNTILYAIYYNLSIYIYYLFIPYTIIKLGSVLSHKHHFLRCSSHLESQTSLPCLFKWCSSIKTPHKFHVEFDDYLILHSFLSPQDIYIFLSLISIFISSSFLIIHFFCFIVLCPLIKLSVLKVRTKTFSNFP